MSAISRLLARSFRWGVRRRRGDSRIVRRPEGVIFAYYGQEIASRPYGSDGPVMMSLRGRNTLSVRSRLNSVLEDYGSRWRFRSRRYRAELFLPAPEAGGRELVMRVGPYSTVTLNPSVSAGSNGASGISVEVSVPEPRFVETHTLSGTFTARSSSSASRPAPRPIVSSCPPRNVRRAKVVPLNLP